MEIKDKILLLTKLANPDNPIDFLKDIARDYSLDKINENIEICDKCELCKNQIKSIAFGNKKSDVLIVSESVSKEQYEEGEGITLPLNDSVSSKFFKVLELINVNKNNIYIANCVNCYPAKKIGNELKKTIPTNKIRATCVSNFLDKIIEALNPAVIITLGAVASNALSGENKIKITTDGGKFFKYKDILVMPTYDFYFFEELEKLNDGDMANIKKEEFLEHLTLAFKKVKELKPECNIFL